MEVSICKMQANEWEIMQKLNVELFEHDNKHISNLDMKWPHSKIGIEYYKKVAKGEDSFQGFIAKMHDIPIGYIALKKQNVSWRTRKYVEIVNISVTAQYRSKGVGTKLLETAEKWAMEQGVNQLNVSAFARNSKALKFYKKFGFDESRIDLEKILS